MGLKNFLKQQGFIEDDSEDKSKENDFAAAGNSHGSVGVTPTFFPVHPAMSSSVMIPSVKASDDPSFVSPILQKQEHDNLDPTFVKFFEDELIKANLPGPDYFEFRQLLNKTQQKMAAKGVAAPEVILQTVLINFETQDISPDKLVEAARQYKTILKQKNDDFLKGAAAEKANQLQKRQQVLQTHNTNIIKIQQQIQELESQKNQLENSLTKEKTQLEVDRTLGKEGIEKIEKAERLISLAHNYIQSTIDTDITKLKSV